MDYIRSFDIRLEKDVYYAGEQINGSVMVENTENIKIRGVRVVLRGKAHAEWKITKSGERRTVRDDQYLLDDKQVVWGKDKHDEDTSIPIMPRGMHQMPFRFHLPQTALPCSFESKAGTIRYYLKVVIDIPYACPPQGMKYFTVIGPHIDCMEEKYLNPMIGADKKTVCCLCCQRGPLSLHVTLERTAYVCGEHIRLKAAVENQSDQSCCVVVRLIQHVEYFIDKGVLGVNKNVTYTVLEHKSPRYAPFSPNEKFDSTLDQPIMLPVVPPSLIGVCRLVQIYYVLKVCIELERSGDELNMEFPFTVATVPFRIPNQPAPPQVEYDFCASHVEGGIYVSPEFQLGQVFDGAGGAAPMTSHEDNVILYRPVYVRIPERVIQPVKFIPVGSFDTAPSTSTVHVTPADTKMTIKGPGKPGTTSVPEDPKNTSNKELTATAIKTDRSPSLNSMVVDADGTMHELVALRNVTLDVHSAPRSGTSSNSSATACITYAQSPTRSLTPVMPSGTSSPRSAHSGITVAETYVRSKVGNVSPNRKASLPVQAAKVNNSVNNLKLVSVEQHKTINEDEITETDIILKSNVETVNK